MYKVTGRRSKLEVTPTLMIKPSRETLRLQRERDAVDKELYQITYRHPRKTVAEASFQTSGVEDARHIKQAPSKQEELLRDLKILRTEYLQNGGKDPQVLAELYQMEREIVDDTATTDISSNDGNGMTLPNQASSALVTNPLPLLANSQQNNSDMSSVAKLERELQEIDLYKEKLIAQHELKILESDLKEEALAMLPVPVKPDVKNVVDTLGYPLSYIPRRGLYFLHSYLDGWRKFKPTAIQFICCLFDGGKPIQKFIIHDWIPKGDHDDISLENFIGKSIPFINLMLKPSIRLIIDIRFTIRNRKDVPFGWTSFDLFRDDALDCGSWKLNLFQHPIVLELSPFALKKLMATIPSAFFYFQIQDGSADLTALLSTTPNPNEHKLKEPQNNESAVFASYNTLSVPTSPLRPVLRKKKKDLEKPEDHQQTLVHQNTTTMKEKVVRDVNAKKFAIGFQLTDLTDFPGIEGDMIIRLVVIDVMLETRIDAFTSPKAEPGEVDGSHGWQFGYFHEIGSITGLSKRKGLFEIVNKGVVAGSCPIDLFKFSGPEAYDICDGVFNPTVTPSKPFSEEGHQPILRVRLYKPKFGQPPIQKFSPRLITPPVTDEAFTYLPAQPATIVDLKKLMNIYISIDSARFLPTNVTVPKLYGRIFSRDRGHFVKGVDFSNSVSLDNSVYSPSLQISKEIPAKLLDPSCLLILELQTMEYFSRATELVGTCVLLLFADAVDASGASSPAINYGGFQLPLFYVKVDRDFLRNDGNIQKYFRVPCASILMRVSDKEVGKSRQPDYTERIYQTFASDVPTEYEALIYMFVLNERKEFSIRDRLLSLGEALPKTARHTDESLITWLTKKFENDYKDSVRIRMIDLSFVTTFNPYYGFKLSVDFASNLTQKEVTFAIVSFTPSFYVLGEKPVNQKFQDDAIYSKFIDYSSSPRSPRWKDGYHWYRNRQPDRDLIAIIQLLGISVNQSSGQVEVVSQGWTLLPIFASDLFVRHGYFKLPLFEGYASNEALESVWKEGEFELEDGIHSRALKFTPKYSSVKCRLSDGRRGGELDPILSTCSEEFLGGYAAKFKTSSYSDSMSSLKYRKQTLADFDKQMMSAFVEATNLPYVP